MAKMNSKKIEIRNVDGERKKIRRRLTPNNLVMELNWNFNLLEEEFPLHIISDRSEEILITYSIKIRETILPILHEYGVRIDPLENQGYEKKKNIKEMTFHEVIRVLTMTLQSESPDQTIKALKDGTMKAIFDKLCYLQLNPFTFSDETLFNMYQRALNQVMNLMNASQKNKDTIRNFNILQGLVRKQRPKEAILHKDIMVKKLKRKLMKENEIYKRKLVKENEIYICPSCTEALNSFKQNFCQQCGQKLLRNNSR